MLLTYTHPNFEDTVRTNENPDGIKIHTLREDKTNRWKVGMSIQHWMGNPRNKSMYPHQFSTGECKGLQDVRIFRTRDQDSKYGYEIFIGFPAPGRQFTPEENLAIAKNDGLTTEEFRNWFTSELEPIWMGRIIHFTDLKY